MINVQLEDDDDSIPSDAPKFRCPICKELMQVKSTFVYDMVAQVLRYTCANMLASDIHNTHDRECWVEYNLAKKSILTAEIAWKRDGKILILSTNDQVTSLHIEVRDASNSRFHQIYWCPALTFEEMTPNFISEHRLRTLITFS